MTLSSNAAPSDLPATPEQPAPSGHSATYDQSAPSDQPAPILTDPRIRAIAPQDVPRTVELIFELAVYEKLPDECHITPEQLHAALFAPNPALFGLAAFTGTDAEATQVGYALYFLNYSTWEGVHGIYLEDLYVSPERRGSGLGKALLTALAATAHDRGYARVEWSVLDWNAPAIAFYRSLGATPMDGWSTFRLSGLPLAQTARGRV
ncbi:MAG: GNAT family N-acetyltransferase [Nakamurella sp.]